METTSPVFYDLPGVTDFLLFLKDCVLALKILCSEEFSWYILCHVYVILSKRGYIFKNKKISKL